MQIEGVGIVWNVIIICCRIWVWGAALFPLWVSTDTGTCFVFAMHEQDMWAAVGGPMHEARSGKLRAEPGFSKESRCLLPLLLLQGLGAGGLVKSRC